MAIGPAQPTIANPAATATPTAATQTATAATLTTVLTIAFTYGPALIKPAPTTRAAAALPSPSELNDESFPLSGF